MAKAGVACIGRFASSNSPFTVIPKLGITGKNIAKMRSDNVAGSKSHLGKACSCIEENNSVYVDDFKMAGVAKNPTQAWQELSKDLELEPPTEFHGGTYLGQNQYNVEVNN